MERMNVPLDAPTNAPNCGVVATAIASGVSYTEAFNAFHGIAEKTHGNWKGATRAIDRRKVLEYFGVKISVVKTTPMTLHKWVNHCAWPNDLYMVTTTGHCQLVHNSHVVDQKGIKTIDNYRWRRKRIRSVWKIER